MSTEVFKKCIERNFSSKSNEEDEDGLIIVKHSPTLKPAGNNSRLIVYLEDLHMTKLDNFGDQPAIETIRDFFTTRRWYSAETKTARKIEHTNFITCFDSLLHQKDNLSRRLLSNFFILGLNSLSNEVSCRIYTQLFELGTADWPHQVSQTGPKLARALT
jgi:hypothetical protein